MNARLLYNVVQGLARRYKSRKDGEEVGNMIKTGAEILWECLEREGVKHVFGYPGGAILPAYDALKHSKIHHVLVRHEQGATHMADGYARASGRVGVAVATSGPGATNMVTGIATAMMDSSPVVCITGQVGSKLIGSDAFQETDITGVTLPITKHNYLVTHASELARTLREAFYVAASGRPGPVLVDITKDAQQSSCEFDWEAAKPQLPGYRPDLSPTAEDYSKALELIQEAKRPVILAGHGILISGAMAEVRDLAERTGIPVTLTLLGLGAFPASHPLNLGMMGMHGEAWVNHTIQDADLLIALGMRFDDRVTGNLKTYAPKARKIQVEIDPTEINKNVKVDVALIGDLREVLRELLPRLQAIDCSEWRSYIDGLKGDAAERLPAREPDRVAGDELEEAGLAEGPRHDHHPDQQEDDVEVDGREGLLLVHDPEDDDEHRTEQRDQSPVVALGGDQRVGDQEDAAGDVDVHLRPPPGRAPCPGDRR